jgi:hypothetical protein
MIDATLASTLIVSPGTALVPGKMYLRLFHGRTSPQQEMNGWGFAGPVFGPLSHYAMTYCGHLRIHAETGQEEVWLVAADDLIQWDGCFYGDLAVFVAGTNEEAWPYA